MQPIFRILRAGISGKGDPGGLVGTRQIGERVARGVVTAHFEMQISVGGAPAIADILDELAASDGISLTHQVGGVMPIDSDVVIVVAHDDHIAVAAQTSRVNYSAAFSSVYRGADRRRDIHPIVHRAVANAEARG